MNKKTDLQIVRSSWTITGHFANILFPVDVLVLLKALPEIGYIVPNKVYKGVIEPGGSMAVKGDCELLVNQDSRNIGIHGSNIQETVDRFLELYNLVAEQLSPKPPAALNYTELQGDYTIETEKNPISVFSNFWSENEKLAKLSQKIGFDVSNHGLRLAYKGSEPNTENWLHLSIEPLPLSSNSQYHVHVVWRDKDMDKALDNFRNLHQIIESIIFEIER